MSQLSNTLTKPPTADCWTGVQHSGEPTGKIEIIGGAETYVALPPSGITGTSQPKGVILFYSDVYGPLFINNKLLQDYFASQGFIVLGIEYFAGDPMYIHNDESGFSREKWFEKAHKYSREVEPVWHQAVLEKYGRSLKYFAVGYCYGGPFALEACASDKVAAGAVVHPGLLNEAHFENLKKPAFFSCAEIDHTFDLAVRRRAEDIILASPHKPAYHLQVFSGVKHGFAIRGDPGVENERWAKEESARSVAGWFTRWSTV